MLKRLFTFAALGLTLAATSSQAWTPATRQVIAAEAARLAPRDLARQIDRHRPEFEAGVEATDPAASKQPLGRTIDQHVAEAIAAIRAHKPFPEVVRRLGGVASEVAYASSPFAESNGFQAARYSTDYLEYAESAESRFPLIFYGITPRLENSSSVATIVDDALRRGANRRPLLEMEYQRIGFASGLEAFDDRSTAFALASTAFSHATTDVMTVLRYIWLKAGGTDGRTHLPAAGAGMVVLSRAYHTR
jgi:hypothetical protein